MTTSFNKGGSDITGYKIYWDNATQNGLFVELTTLNDGTLTNYITSSVTQGSTYAFKISALNIYGEGIESDEISITPAAPPDPPTDFTLISADTSHISFSWTPGYTGGKAISNYLIKWD